jgi:NAD-dependent deacetylase
MNRKKITFLTGAGISANAGIPTYRDVDGLWKTHDFLDVASIDGWRSNPALVLEFYNERIVDLEKAKPTKAHLLIAQLERDYDVTVVTQNVDDLHEKAGSTNIIHFHGELFFKCNSRKTYYEPYDKPIKIGDLAPDGSQFRPAVTMFGEEIMADQATIIANVLSSDYVVIIGTSMEVYPFADIPSYLPSEAFLLYIDKNNTTADAFRGIKCKHQSFNYDADTGMEKFIELLNA